MKKKTEHQLHIFIPKMLLQRL